MTTDCQIQFVTTESRLAYERAEIRVAVAPIEGETIEQLLQRINPDPTERIELRVLKRPSHSEMDF